jgi:integrase
VTSIVMDKDELLKDNNVIRWHENLKEGSMGTADLYLHYLLDYCNYRRMTPSALVGEFQRNKKKAQDSLEDYIQWRRKKLNPTTKRPPAPKSLNVMLSSVKSWFRHSELSVTREINVGNVRETPTIEQEQPPSQKELRRILDHAGPRTRASITLIAFAGIRPNAIGGLLLADMPELKIQSGKASANVEPMIIKVRSQLSKNKRPYLTFLIREGIDYLTAYLNERLAQGETLVPTSPVIGVSTTTATRGTTKRKGEAIGRKAISAIMRRAMRSSDTSVSKFRPYVLRSYFDWALQNAKLPHTWEQFVMGHSGPIESDYSVHKNLRTEQIEQMRQAFKESVEPVLTTNALVIGVSKEDLQLTKYESMLEYAYLRGDFPLSSDDTVKVVEDKVGRPLSTQEKSLLFKALAFRQTEGHVLEDETGEIRTWISYIAEETGTTDIDLKTWLEDKRPQKQKVDPKVIEEEELQEYLDNGWEIKTVLPSGKIVVSK